MNGMEGIIDWLDGRIAETAKEKANDKDDYALLLDGERLQAYRSARAHMSALRGTANYTIHYLAEMADVAISACTCCESCTTSPTRNWTNG